MRFYGYMRFYGFTVGRLYVFINKEIDRKTAYNRITVKPHITALNRT